MKILNVLGTVAVMTAAVIMSSSVSAGENKKGRGSIGAPVVYVTSQGLYYDSIVVTSLPMKGDFQQLVPGPNGLSTEYGPGEVGHLGGRWWIDTNVDGEMDENDLYFLCPLLGPGRETM